MDFLTEHRVDDRMQRLSLSQGKVHGVPGQMFWFTTPKTATISHWTNFNIKNNHHNKHKVPVLLKEADNADNADEGN